MSLNDGIAGLQHQADYQLEVMAAMQMEMRYLFGVMLLLTLLVVIFMRK